MSHDVILAKINTALLTVLIVSGPALLAAVVVGLVVGLVQALTQIQDQTLPQAVKLIVVLLLIILLLGPVLSRQIFDEAVSLFDEFPVITR